jgi:hypothetical protein
MDHGQRASHISPQVSGKWTSPSHLVTQPDISPVQNKWMGTSLREFLLKSEEAQLKKDVWLVATSGWCSRSLSFTVLFLSLFT